MEVFPKWLIFLSNMNKRKKNPIYFLGIFCPNVEKFKFSTSNDVGKERQIWSLWRIDSKEKKYLIFNLFFELARYPNEGSENERTKNEWQNVNKNGKLQIFFVIFCKYFQEQLLKW